MNRCCKVLRLLLTLGPVIGLIFAQGNPRPGGKAGGRGAVAAAAETPTLPANDAEKRVLAVLDDIFRTQRQGSMSVPTHDGRILRVLTEALGAKQVVEIGTSVGYSGTWFCLALQQTGGRLTTFEIDPQRAARARANFQRAGVDHLVTLVEGDAHERVAAFTGSIDLLFLDADKEGYLDYLQKLLPKVRPGGLIVAHNINDQQADPRYVKAITTDPSLETVIVNLATSGISITLKKR
jgi:predicted O-methyltransferase YrrM